jgi:hypothetical protein
MTHEDETRDRVRRAGDELPVSPAPVQDLLTRGRRAKRRRTVTTIGVVAAVAVVTSGAVAVGSQLSTNATNNPSVSPPTPDAPSLTPPPGMRLVGRNGIGIAVPASWGTNRSLCQGWLVFSEITMGHGTTSCYGGMGSQTGSRVVVSDYNRSTSSLATSSERLDDILVERVAPYSPSACLEYCPAWIGELGSAKRDVTITVTSDRRSSVQEVLDSAFAIPQGFVALPAPAGQLHLAELGFVVHTTTRLDNSVPPRTTLGLEPAAGTVVSRGSTVTIVYSRSNRSPNPCPGLHVSVGTATGQLPITSPNAPYRVNIRVGDVITLDAQGECSADVTLKSASPHVLRGSLHTMTGLQPGHTSFSIRIPYCADIQSPMCIGRVSWLGKVRVHVTS